jgi:hypothetical protein
VRNVPVGLALLLLVGCGEQTGPPTINYVKGDNAVVANDRVEIESQAWDWGLAPITFEWTSPRGSFLRLFEDRTRSVVRWYAPESSGDVTLRLVVTDLDNETATDTFPVTVRKVTTSLINYQGAVKAGLFRDWPESLRVAHRIKGDFAFEDSTLLSFYVLEEADYQRWLARDSFGWLVARESSPADTFSATVPATDWYRVVVDNRAGKVDRTLNLRLTRTTP